MQPFNSSLRRSERQEKSLPRDRCSCHGWRRTSETDRVCGCVPVEGEFKLEVDVVIVRFNAEELYPASWEPSPPLPEILSCIVGKVLSEEGGKESMLRVKKISVPRESEREEVERHPRLHSAEEDDRLLNRKSASGVLCREDGAGSSSHEVAWARVRRAQGASGRIGRKRSASSNTTSRNAESCSGNSRLVLSKVKRASLVMCISECLCQTERPIERSNWARGWPECARRAKSILLRSSDRFMPA